MIRVPELVRQRAASCGAAGAAWLSSLPDVVASLAHEWELTVGSVLSGGTASLVVDANDAAGRECVVKIGHALRRRRRSRLRAQCPVPRARRWPRLCRAPAPRLDPARHAARTARAEPRRPRVASPADPRGHRGDIAHLLAPGRRRRLPSGADKAAWLAEYITRQWHDLRRPCDRAVVDRAIDLCGRRADAFDPTTAVLVHADAHGWNTLRAAEGSHKFVDPEGLRSDRANDLAVPMREYNEPLLAGDTARLVWQRAEFLADLCDVDAVDVWEWGFIERVSTGLANLADFDGGEGHAFLEVARRCL